MYRIRLVSGGEAAYGSVDELVVAVAAGTVTDQAEIYHAKAEKWLPIASHPHFKLAKDRVGGGVPQRPSIPRAPAMGSPAATASGQRPAINVSAQRPAINGTAPHSTTATTAGTAAPTQVRVARQAPAQRPPRPAPQQPATLRPPAAAAPSVPNDFGLLRADAILDAAPHVQGLPDLKLEQTPTIQEPQVVAPVKHGSRVVEQPPTPVELVSVQHAAAPVSSRVDIIHPDRAMPEMRAEPPRAARESVRELPSLQIPSPVHDFAPVEAPDLAPLAPRKSRAPMFIGITIAAAAAIGAGVFFMRKPADAPTAAADTRPPVVSSSAPAAPAATPSGDPGPAGTRAANLTTNPALDTRTTRTGEQSTKRSRKAAATAEPAAGADGLEPPPRVVLPAAPSVRGISDAAALPTVDAEAPDLVDKKKALERTVREIDSSMRRESGESGDLTR